MSLDENRPLGMITRIDDFFALGCGRCERFATPDCSTRRWLVGLTKLREICLSLGLVETVKWGQPCYRHRDRNLAIFGALRADFRLGFFDAALLQDPHGVLERSGPNTRHPDTIRFTANERVAELEPVITTYLLEAMGYAEAGVRPPKQQVVVEIPDELAEALAIDVELAAAFDALTPGRQRSYAIAIGSAKKRETRLSRIAGFRDKILAGKGANER